MGGSRLRRMRTDHQASSAKLDAGDVGYMVIDGVTSILTACSWTQSRCGRTSGIGSRSPTEVGGRPTPSGQ